MAMSDRSCGSCSLCCKLLAIESIAKEPGVWCAHFKKGGGCGIYEARPGECRAFACQWLKLDGWEPEWKPDKSKFVMMGEDDGKRLKVVVDPSFPDAWRREPYYSRFKRMSETAVEGRRVIITIGKRQIVIFPDRDHDLGEVSYDAQIVSGIHQTPGGLVSYAHVAEAAAS
jgi:hypothetical protein